MECSLQKGHAHHPVWRRDLSAGHHPFCPTQRVPWNGDTPTTSGGPGPCVQHNFISVSQGFWKIDVTFFLNEETE